MSILNVENISHGFGGRTIFEDVTFRLLKGEHVALVGANGEGKSTFLSIITGKMTPDQGKVEWAKRVNVGYLDQHSVVTGFFHWEICFPRTPGQHDYNFVSVIVFDASVKFSKSSYIHILGSVARTVDKLIGLLL